MKKMLIILFLYFIIFNGAGSFAGSMVDLPNQGKNYYLVQAPLQEFFNNATDAPAYVKRGGMIMRMSELEAAEDS
jgi:hypothetical protein